MGPYQRDLVLNSISCPPRPIAGGEIVARSGFAVASSRPESRRLGAENGPRADILGLAGSKLGRERTLFAFDRVQEIPLSSDPARHLGPGRAPRWWNPRNLLRNKA